MKKKREDEQVSQNPPQLPGPESGLDREEVREMTAKPDRNDPNERFVRITYRPGAPITEEEISRAEALSPTHPDVDYYRNEARREAVIHPQTGSPLVYKGDIPRVGPIAWELQSLHMNAPGEFLTVDEIYQRTLNESFADAGNVQSFVRNMRSALGESGDAPWFLLSSADPSYAVCWSDERSWMIIRKEGGPATTRNKQ